MTKFSRHLSSCPWIKKPPSQSICCFFIDMRIKFWLLAVTYSWYFSPNTSSACQNLAIMKYSPHKYLVAVVGSIFSHVSATPVLLTSD